MLVINVNKNGNKVTVATEGVIDTETASNLSATLLELDYSNLDLTLDFDKTDYITSAGLRVLLVARKKLTDDTMRIINVNEPIELVFKVTGFSDILNYSGKKQDVVDCHMSWISCIMFIRHFSKFFRHSTTKRIKKPLNI